MIRSLEVEDASQTSAALLTLQRWMERIAEEEVGRITAKRQRYQAGANRSQHGRALAWMNASVEWSDSSKRVQMLLGIFATHGVLPLDFKPAYNVGDLLLQRLDALERKADEKGGLQQLLADHFAKFYKVNMSLSIAA